MSDNERVRKPRVLFLVTDALGWKTYALHLQRQLAGQEELEAALHYVPSRLPARLMRKLRWGDPFAGLAMAWKGDFEQMVRDFRPDHIHCATQVLALHWSRREQHIPYSLMADATRVISSINNGEPPATRKQIALEEQVFRFAGQVFGFSNWMLSSAVNDYGVAPERTSRFLPSVTVPMVDPVGRGEMPRLVFVGSNLEWKGGDRLLRWHAQHFRTAAELHVVGPPPVPELIGENVVWHGPTANDRLVEEILPGATALIHPTRFDMSSWVVCEAAARGVPAVASRIGGIPDLIDDGETGFLHEATDDDAFIGSIQTLLGDPPRAGGMGKAAHEKARREMNADVNYPRMFHTIADGAASSATV